MQRFVVAAVAAAATAAVLLPGVAPAATRTVDLTLSCASAMVAGTPTVQVQFIGGYAGSPAWVGVVKTSSGMLQLAQVGARVPPHYVKGSCRPVRTKVALAPRGLPGPASAFDSFQTCSVSHARVLIRIRATVDGSHVVTATLIVRTLEGKAVAWVAVGANGKGRFLTSARCTG